MICKSCYIQYGKRRAYLRNPQSPTEGKNKYDTFTIENFYIKEYTSHSHSCYFNICCPVVVFEFFAHCANGLFITRHSYSTMKRNTLIQSHYFRTLSNCDRRHCTASALWNTLLSFQRLRLHLVKMSPQTVHHTFVKLANIITHLIENKDRGLFSGRFYPPYEVYCSISLMFQNIPQILYGTK